MVSGVHGDHLSGQANDDVQGFVINSKNLGLLPRNVPHFFPNLLAFEADNVGLWEISREDLEPFHQLQSLSLRGNGIQAIDSNSFIGNSQLRAINLNDNLIQHVPHNVFNQLSALTTLHMTGALMCHSESVDNNRAGVEAMTVRIAVNCMMTFETTEAKILNGDNLHKLTDQRITDRLDPLTVSLLKQIQKLEERIAQLERNVGE